MSWTTVCRTDAVPEGLNVLGVDAAGTPVAVVRGSDGTFHALHDDCTHQHIALSSGEVEDDQIECPLHGSCFDLRTGEPSCLPAIRPVNVYACRVDGDDVQVDVTQIINRREK